MHSTDGTMYCSTNDNATCPAGKSCVLKWAGQEAYCTCEGQAATTSSSSSSSSSSTSSSAASSSSSGSSSSSSGSGAGPEPGSERPQSCHATEYDDDDQATKCEGQCPAGAGCVAVPAPGGFGSCACKKSCASIGETCSRTKRCCASDPCDENSPKGKCVARDSTSSSSGSGTGGAGGGVSYVCVADE